MDLNILLVPWINKENEDETFKRLKNQESCSMGHLELNGFRIHRGYMMEHGMDATPFDKFEKVYSGHYHTRSDQEPVYYLGNPYEMFWNDVNDTEEDFIFLIQIL